MIRPHGEMRNDAAPVTAPRFLSQAMSNRSREFADIREEQMKRRGWWKLVVLAAAMIAATIPEVSFAQQKKLVLWTHWDQNPEFNKWYAEKGKEFAKKSGYEVEVVTIPYQGYEAKYLAAFMAKNSAPDIFMGMTHQWCVMPMKMSGALLFAMKAARYFAS